MTACRALLRVHWWHGSADGLPKSLEIALDVYQVTLTCAKCGRENRAILSASTTEATCNSCDAQVLKARRFAGVIYVMSHPNVDGVKIGKTERNVFTRAKQISGTGVPGQFVVMAAFPSVNPDKDERKVHEKLSRSWMDKEHFDLDPVVAVTKIRSILSREPAYIDPTIEAAVAALREEQRLKAFSRFASSHAPKSENAEMPCGLAKLPRS